MSCEAFANCELKSIQILALLLMREIEGPLFCVVGNTSRCMPPPSPIQKWTTNQKVVL